MKVLFVYPNIAQSHSPQVGLSSLAGTLIENGHDCRLFDLTFLDLAEAPDKFREAIGEYLPDLIGISCRSTEWQATRGLLSLIENKIPVVIGGPHPTIAPEEVIAEERVDMLVRGEGEEALLDLVERMEAGRPLRDMPNLWVKEDGKVYRNELRPLIQDLDSLAMPEWSIWDGRHFRDSYHQAFSPGAEIFGDLETSRGCPYSCPYCLNPAMQKIYKGKGRYHREKSAARVIKEIEKMRDELRIDYIRFVDETFILNKKRIKEFCRLYENIRLPFYFMTRPETVNDEIFADLAAVGANCVSFGLESGNEQYRREMLNRKTTQQQVINAMKISKKHGLKTFAFAMIGLPQETRAGIQDTMELINIVQPDVFEVSIFYPFEGTPFYHYCIDHGLMKADHEQLAEIVSGSVLNQPGLSSDYLVRLRALMLAFAKRDRRLWPLMRFLEKRPLAFKIWKVGRRFWGRGMKELRRGSRRKKSSVPKQPEMAA